MISIAITVKGLDSMPDKLRKVRVGILARVASMLQSIGQEVATRSVEDHLSGPRPKNLGRISGDLARSINYKVVGSRVVIGSNLPYARIHEYGGTIVPKKAKALVFKLPNGQWRRVAKVTIPERSFLRSALKESIPAAKGIIQRFCNEALKEALA